MLSILKQLNYILVFFHFHFFTAFQKQIFIVNLWFVVYLLFTIFYQSVNNFRIDILSISFWTTSLWKTTKKFEVWLIMAFLELKRLSLRFLATSWHFSRFLEYANLGAFDLNRFTLLIAISGASKIYANHCPCASQLFYLANLLMSVGMLR